MHWVDELVERLAKRFEGKKEIVFNGGLSVSGLQHVGRLRGEVIMNDVLARELRKRGFRTKLFITLYTMDARKGKRPQVEQFESGGERYRGRPLIEVPDPKGCHDNRVEHYRSDFGPYIDRFTSAKIEVVRTDEMYKTERMREIIEEFVEKREIVREIINKYRKRRPFPEGRIPFNPQCERCRRIDSAEALEYKDGMFKYRCNACGNEGVVPYYKGKLNRRLERVAVRKYLNVDFEPYGKDHAAPGGSRDSCNELAQALGITPPEGEWYERVAERKNKVERDMSSSSFVGFTPKDRLEVARPEVLRFLFLVVDPHKRVVLSLEEIPLYYQRFYKAESKYYEGVKDEETRSYELSLLSEPYERIPVQVPYEHMAILSQTLPRENKLEEAIKRLRISGIIPEKLEEYDIKRIESLLELSYNRAKRYAPERMRIEILTEAPEEDPGDLKPILKRLAEELENVERTPEAIVEGMKRVNEGLDKRTIRRLFKFLYKIFIGKESGPRIANLFSTLPKEFVIKRIREYL